MRTSFALLLTLFCSPFLLAQQPKATLGDPEPVLQLRSLGPTARITAMAFSSDGKFLYAGGLDKVVHVWQQKEDGSGFEPLPGKTYRIPINPGLQGTINALAASADDKWLAIAGQGVVRDTVTFHNRGKILPRAGFQSEAMKLDGGQIYLVERGQQRKMKLLRGHVGKVLSLTFAPAKENAPAILASCAQERNEENKFVGRVRVWNVDTGKEIAPAITLSNPKDRRPGLAILRTGMREKDVLIGIAWGEGGTGAQDPKFRVWDVARETVRKEPSGLFDDTVVALPLLGDRTFLTGAHAFYKGDNAYAILQGWNSDKNKALSTLKLDARCIPRALQLCARGANGKPDLLAVVLQYPGKTPEGTRNDTYGLGLFSLGNQPNEERGKFLGVRKLWTRSVSSKPVLAASPSGKFLALAGNEQNQILLYRIDQVLQNPRQLQQRPADVLQSEGAPRKYVHFAEKGRQQGLIVNHPDEKGKSDKAVFNFANSSLSRDVQGWNEVQPPAKGWKVKFTKPNKFEITNPEGNKTATITLPDEEIATVYRLLESPPKCKVPILAVGHFELGVAGLTLYECGKGERVRVLTGHQGMIKYLSFSKDGQLLASASEDQTINLWRMTDLEGLMDQQGMLRGLTLGKREGKLVVLKSTFDVLKVDEVVQGIVRDGKLIPFKEPRTFYNAIWRLKPGTTVTLKVGRIPVLHKDVQVTVGQGIDEQRPLLTLYLTRDQEWAGWSAQGPYDVSSEKTERLMGWHRNPALPKDGEMTNAPTFSKVKEHRKEMYRKGLFSELIVAGDLPEAIRRQLRERLPQPALDAEISEQERLPLARDNKGVQILQRTPATLYVAIDGDFEPGFISWVRWRTGPKAKWQDFTEEQGNELRADLSDLNWKRGYHRIQVELRTFELNPREIPTAVNVLYLPPPPLIRFPADWLKQFQIPLQKDKLQEVSALVPLMRSEHQKPEFTFKVDVQPGKAGQALNVALWRRDTKSDKLIKVKDLQTGAIEVKVKLEEGRNELVLIAENQGLLKDHEEYERVVRHVVIDYHQVAKPGIVVESVRPVTDESRPPLQSQTVIVPRSKVAIQGRIEAETDLTEAVWIHNGKTQTLPGFDASKGMKKLRFQIPEAQLKLGKQTITIRAQSKDSKPTLWTLNLEYQPPLPDEFALISPQDLPFLHPKDATTTLEGKLSVPVDHPIQVQILVNEKVLGTIKEYKGEIIRVKDVKLNPGINDVQIRVQIGNRSRIIPLEAYVRQFPKILKYEVPEKFKEAFGTITAEVDSPEALPLTGARLTSLHFDGEQRAMDLTPIQGAAKDFQRWRITMKNVPLKQGKTHPVRLLVKNDDGETPTEKPVMGPSTPPPTKAKVVMDSPTRPVQTSLARGSIRFTITSESPLQRVAIHRDGEELQIPFDVKAGFNNHEVVVPLRPGVNHFKVIAINNGGESVSDEASISYVPETVRVTLTRLLTGEGEPGVLPVSKDGSVVVFDQVKQGEVTLEGYVEWGTDLSPEFRHGFDAHVQLNGFEQHPGAVEKGPKGLKRYFAVKLSLNQEQDNQGELSIPGLKIDDSSQTKFKVRKCLEPVRDQRLHVVVIGVGEQKQQALTESVLKTLHVKNSQPGSYRNLVEREFQTPTFRKINRLYVPLPPDASRADIYHTLRRINNLIRREQRGDSNDVLIVYFQGEAIFDAERQRYYLLTAQSKRLGDHVSSAVTLHGLRTALIGSMGAKLLLVDVYHPERKNKLEEKFLELDLSHRDQISEMHYAWLRSPPKQHEQQLIGTLRETLTQVKLLGEVFNQVDRTAKKEEDLTTKLHVTNAAKKIPFGVPK